MNRHFSIAVAGAIVAATIVLPLLIFAAARAFNSGEIAPNVVVGGVHVGGLSEEDALAKLAEHEQMLQTTPAPFVVADRTFALTPTTVGLELDEEPAVTEALDARNGGGFIDQFADWVRSFRTTIEVPIDATVDEEALDEMFERWESDAIGQPAEEGGIQVIDGSVEPDYPRAGIGIDRVAAPPLVRESLLNLDRVPVDLPTGEIIPRVTTSDVDAAVLLARNLVDGPIVLSSDDPAVEIEFSTADLTSAVRSHVTGGSPAEVTVDFDADVIQAILEPRRSEIERAAQDARFVINDNESVSIVPSQRATLLDAGLVAAELRQVGTRSDRGEFPFGVGAEASFTTAEAQAMGPITRVSSATTEHPPGQDRVTNIHLMADAVDRAVVWPGESFSLNEHVGERTVEKGYVPAPMILAGEIVDDVGGGVSQFATTFYNAVFFGCYEDVSHQPHSYYFSRYPAGREATISWPRPDLVFRNDTDAVVIIDTSYSSTSITVRFFGSTAGRDCDSESSDRYNFTNPETVFEGDSAVAPGTQIVDQTGWEGWSIDITRIMRFDNGSEQRQSWTHRYLAGPEIIRVHPCEVPGSNTVCPIQVPSVLGLTFDAAAANLAEAGFVIEDGGTVEVSDESQAGKVQSQDPGAGSYIAPGSPITVLTGVHVPPPTTTTVPPPAP